MIRARLLNLKNAGNLQNARCFAVVFSSVIGICCLFGLSAPVFAATDGVGGIPTKVYYQFLNLTLFVGIVFYFVRQPAVQFFASRRQQFLDDRQKAQETKRLAEKKNQELKKLYDKSVNEEQQTIRNAKKQAQEMAESIVRNSEQLADQLMSDAKRTLESEKERAEKQLSDTLLDRAFEGAHALLKDRIQETDQERLQAEFVKKVQVVR